MTERMLSGYQADIKKALYQSNLHCNIRPQYLEWEQISLHLRSTKNSQSCGRKLGAVKKIIENAFYCSLELLRTAQ